MKKRFVTFVAIISSLLILFSVAVASSCKNKNSPPQAMSVKDMYALAVSAGASYLGEQNTSPALLSTTNSLSRPTAVDNDMDNLNKYVKMFEGYLIGGNTNVVIGGVSSEELNLVKGGYTITENTNKMVITLPMLNGENFVYTLYYTEAKEGDAGYVKFNDKDEQEIISVISGVVEVSATEFYTVTGSRKTEIELNEYETELDITIKGNNEYIVMEFGKELEPNETEQEFEFKIFSIGGALVTSTSIEFERDKQGVVLELEFNDDVALAEHLKYTIRQEGNAIRVFYLNATSNGNVLIEKLDTGYRYTYSNGYTENLPQ